MKRVLEATTFWSNMSIKIERHQDRILLWDYEKTRPIILEHDEAFDMAKTLLDLCGQMRETQEEEAVA
jgi:hypothetical protein